MALDITQHSLDRCDLVVLVGHDGLVEWSANETRSREQIARVLEDIADGIRKGEL